MNATTIVPLEGIMSFLNAMSLSAQNKRWLGEHLIEQALKEELSAKGSQTKKVKIRCRSNNSPSDAELEARFDGLAVPELPADPDWRQVISANTGKTISPIEKWL